VAQPFFIMILYDCNLKCLAYVHMGKKKCLNYLSCYSQIFDRDHVTLNEGAYHPLLNYETG